MSLNNVYNKLSINTG